MVAHRLVCRYSRSLYDSYFWFFWTWFFATIIAQYRYVLGLHYTWDRTHMLVWFSSMQEKDPGLRCRVQVKLSLCVLRKRVEAGTRVCSTRAEPIKLIWTSLVIAASHKLAPESQLTTLAITCLKSRGLQPTRYGSTAPQHITMRYSYTHASPVTMLHLVTTVCHHC